MKVAAQLGVLMCVVSAFLAPTQGVAQAARVPPLQRLEVYVGPSSLMLLGPVSGEIGWAFDVGVQGPLHATWRWMAGARLAMSPIAPEMFGGVSAQPRFGRWSPSVGVELGLTARGLADQGDRLLMELRDVSSRDLVPLYVALYAAPLRFHVSPRWRLSLLELGVGTHVAPFGRYVRLQLLLAAIGVAL